MPVNLSKMHCILLDWIRSVSTIVEDSCQAKFLLPQINNILCTIVVAYLNNLAMFDAYVKPPVTGFPTPNVIHVEVQNFGTARGTYEYSFRLYRVLIYTKFLFGKGPYEARALKDFESSSLFTKPLTSIAH